MRTRRRFLVVVGSLALAGCNDSGAETEGDPDGQTDRPTTVRTDRSGETTAEDKALAITTPVFEDGESIPSKYTADGEDVSPPLGASGVPGGTETLALVVDDPDAPGGAFVHWLLWNVPASTTEIPEGISQTETVARLDGPRQGTNGFGDLGYRGPKPPTSDGPHTYRFTLYAVDSTLEVQARAKRGPLEDALDDHSMASTRITGEYDRN